MRAGTREAEACAYIVGDDGLARWTDVHGRAWLGLLQTSRRLVRELDAELETGHGLSLSGLELLGRLAAADRRQLRLSALASQTGLSLSRVSRIVGSFERRGLVERRDCPEDARGTYAWLTEDGLRLAREAQAAHFDDVQARFFDRLDDEKLHALAEIFAGLEQRER